MEFLKELFANGALTWEQFQTAVNDNEFKLANLSTGNYVSKGKYTDDLAAKDEQIKTLNETLATRDGDLMNVKKQLEKAGTDKGKLSELNTELENLRTKYDTDTADYKERLASQEYEFAVKDFANGKKFSSNAAKRDFINSMTTKKLTLDGGKIIGAEDFVSMYQKENADAFIADEKGNEAEGQNNNPPPSFAGATGGGDNKPKGGLFDFGFTGVRPRESK